MLAIVQVRDSPASRFATSDPPSGWQVTMNVRELYRSGEIAPTAESETPNNLPTSKSAGTRFNTANKVLGDGSAREDLRCGLPDRFGQVRRS